MPIQNVKKECDLGVIIDNKLKFHSHCQNQAAKANKVLCLIKHSVTSFQLKVIQKLYAALACPHFEFGMFVATKHFKCDMMILGKVQDGVTKLPFAKQQISWKQQLEKLQLPTLMYCRKRWDVFLAFKVMTSYTIKPIWITVNTWELKETL